MFEIFSFITLGLIAGILSGLIGIGGGIIIIPALVLLYGLNQHQAQGTTLAMMVPPVGILAAWTYYKNGNVDIKIAVLMCVGFFIGGFIGAKFANQISNLLLQKIFGVSLLLIAIKMIFVK